MIAVGTRFSPRPPRHLGIRPVSRLNTWPVVSPVNASRRPSRDAAHHSGSGWLARPSPWGTFTSYSLPAFLAHSQQGHFVETFMLDSWIEHLRQHERVTNADRELQDRVNRYQVDGAPKVTHLIAASEG